MKVKYPLTLLSILACFFTSVIADPNILLQVLPTDDAYVRDGSHSSSNNGSDDKLILKNATVDFNRESYLRFEVPVDPSIILGATLELHFSGGGSNGATTNVDYTVTNWSEDTLNWNNKPTSQGTITTIANGDGTVLVDLTTYMQSLGSGVEAVSFRLHNDSGGDNWKRIDSKEGSVTPRLSLQVNSSQSVSVADDAYVRDGSYSNDNFGADVGLKIKTDGPNYNRQSFIGFDLPVHHDFVANAELQLEFSGGSSNNATTHIGYTSTNWTEGGITWNKRPSSQGLIESLVNPDGAVSIDVSSYIASLPAGTDEVSFILYNENDGGSNFKLVSSSESSGAVPMLNIDLIGIGDWLSVLEPTPSATYAFNETIVVEAVETSPGSVDEVQIFLDGVLQATISALPFTWTSPSNLSIGTHQLVVDSLADGALIDSDQVDFSVAASQDLWTNFYSSSSPRLTDWSAAGYKFGEESFPSDPVSHHVSAYGALPDDAIDDTLAVQAAIDAAGASGGGVVGFDAGEYRFQSTNNLTDALVVSDHGVVLRGTSSGAGGTVLRQMTKNPNGVDFNDKEALIRVGSSVSSSQSQNLLADALKHSKEIRVANNSVYAVGDLLSLQMTRNVNTNYDLALPLAVGSTIETSWTNFNRFDSCSVITQVKSIEADGETIGLEQPLPRDWETQYSARVMLLNPNDVVAGFGLENLRIKGGFDGSNYSHHGSWEDDYGWIAIRLLAAAHSWVSDVVVEDMTQDIFLDSNTMNITVEDITSIGRGHFGSQVRGSFNLIQDYELTGSRTHFISFSAGAIANVYTSINNTSGATGSIDFHGAKPANCNLVENSKNLRINSGGATSNMPHAGQFNTFWNITAGPKRSVEDYFTHGWYNYNSQTPYGGSDLHQLYPKSLLVGIRRPNSSITVDGSISSRDTSWLYVDGVGTTVYPESIYKAQFNNN